MNMGLEWITAKLIDLLPIISEVSKSKRELADNALRSVSHALTETCLYVSRYLDQGKRDPEIETQLSRYWSAAAIPLRHIDNELSQICEYKSEYWINPEGWNHAKAKGAKIDLETVREKYRAKLNG